MKKAARKQGFTLVEVIIVLVIMVIIASLAGPNIIGWIDHAEGRNCKAITNSMLDEISAVCNEKRFSNENGDYTEAVNKAILGVVKFYANNNSLEVDRKTGKFYVETKGICPHGGTHTIEWRFEDTFDETGTHVISSTVKISVKCDSHNGEFTLDTALGIKDSSAGGSNAPIIPPGAEGAVEILPDISTFLEDFFKNASGKPELRAQQWLDEFQNKIENDPDYSKYFTQENIEKFDEVMGDTNPNVNNIFDKYIMDYLFNTVMAPQVHYGDKTYPIYISMKNDNIKKSDEWLFYANDGYGGTSTTNYANIVCVRSLNNGVLTAQTWYKYTGSDKYLNLSGQNLTTNQAVANYVKNNPDKFTKLG